jgi:hypothetical protein
VAYSDHGSPSARKGDSALAFTAAFIVLVACGCVLLAAFIPHRLRHRIRRFFRRRDH